MAQMYRDARHVAAPDRGLNVAARLVSLVGGVITMILALRFILVLLGANAANGFANFIYTLSRPFVAPFYGLFNYQPQFGTVRFEWETLVAILFWGIVTWVIVRLLTVGNRADNEY